MKRPNNDNGAGEKSCPKIGKSFCRNNLIQAVVALTQDIKVKVIEKRHFMFTVF
jgi:hypothetical protein